MTETPWPTHPDGTNMTIGEMPLEIREKLLSEGRARWLARRDPKPETIAAVDRTIKAALK